MCSRYSAQGLTLDFELAPCSAHPAINQKHKTNRSALSLPPASVLHLSLKRKKDRLQTEHDSPEQSRIMPSLKGKTSLTSSSVKLLVQCADTRRYKLRQSAERGHVAPDGNADRRPPHPGHCH